MRIRETRKPAGQFGMPWFYQNGTPWVFDSYGSTASYEYIRDKRHGPGPVTHYSFKAYSKGDFVNYTDPAIYTAYTTKPDQNPVGVGLFFHEDWLRDVLGKGLSYAPNLHLNPNKVEFQNNGFEILTIAAEAKESLQVFTPKFWKEMTYGSYNWGLAPLVSEVRGILEAISDAGSAELDWEQPYEDEETTEFSIPLTCPNGYAGQTGDWSNITFSGSVTSRVTGKVKLPDGSDYLAFLDSIGFHPDLKTVYDLTPLSFLIDYVFPLGDFLDQIINRGWVKSMVFEGYESCKLIGTLSGGTRDVPPGNPGSMTIYGKHILSYYSRSQPLFRVIEDDGSVDVPQIKLPSLRQAFNIGYLAQNVKSVQLHKKRGIRL